MMYDAIVVKGSAVMTDEFIKHNYHTHTWRCKHAQGSEREYVEEAIAAGITVLGFSDHVPCNFSDGHVSGVRMLMEQTAEYKDCIEALKKEYEADIEIHVGFESEYIPAYFEYHKSLIEKEGFEYFIMGEHFLDFGGSEGIYTGTPTDERGKLDRYVELVLEGAATGFYKYIAHPDIIHFTGDPAYYDVKIRELCKGLKLLNIPLEINVLGYATNRHYPSARFFDIASEVGNEVIIGMDAHSVAHLTDKDSYQACLRFARERGLALIDEISFE